MEILRLFVEELQVLTNEGLTSVQGQHREFQVVLLVFLADNLAAHALGGFKESYVLRKSIMHVHN